jgi:hypothetical protein
LAGTKAPLQIVLTRANRQGQLVFHRRLVRMRRSGGPPNSEKSNAVFVPDYAVFES